MAMMKYVTRKRKERDENESLSESDENVSIIGYASTSTTKDNKEKLDPQRSQINENLNVLLLDLGAKNEGPRQPILQFPKNTFGNQQRSFSSTWYNKFPWLEYSTESDAAFCFSCRHFSVFGCGYSNDLFITKGMRDWKDALEKFRKHQKCNSHKSAQESYLCYLQTLKDGTVAQLQVNANIQDIKDHRTYLSKIIDVLILTAKQGMAQRGHREDEQSDNRGNFLETLALFSKYDDNPEIKMPKNSTYKSHDIQNELLEASAFVIRKKIIDEIKKSEIISILADESRDIRKTEQMSFCVRYFFDGSIHERFLNFTGVSDLTAPGLKKVLLHILHEAGIADIEIVAQSYDGAPVMSGEDNGLQELFREKYKKAIYIHCYAHRLNLVLVDVCNAISEIREFFSMASAIYAYFSKSGLAHEGLQEILLELKIGKTELQELSDTRWACQIRSLKAIRKTYPALIQYLENPKDACDPCKAKGLLIFLKNPNNIVVLLLLIKLFGITEILHSYLQSAAVDLGEAINAVESVKESLQKLRTDKDYNLIIEKARVLVTELGLTDNFLVRKSRRGTRVSSHLNDFVVDEPLGQRNSDIELLQHLKVNIYFAAIDRLIAELNSRFTGGPNLGILRAIECMNPNWLVTKWEDFLSLDRLRVFCEHYEVKMPEDQIVVAKNFLKKEILKLKEPAINMVSVLNLLPKAMYPELYKIFQIAVTIPVGTASNERSFNVLKRIKDWLRNTMGQQRLSSSALMAIEKKLTKKVCIDCIIDRFADVKKRRVELTHTSLIHSDHTIFTTHL